jgi:transmembrane sensor
VSADDQRLFETWLASSAAHREAYERAQSMWSHFERDADSSELRALRTAALGVTPAAKPWPQMAAAIAAVGCLAWLAAVGFKSTVQNNSAVLPGAASRAAGEKYITARNERSTVTLSDGTVVTLNLDTALDVAFTPSERLVRITHGQAFFEVAHNPQRPSVVAAADRRISVLGTQFDVRLDPDRVEVVLLEGRVAVDHALPSMLERLNLRSAHVELWPGQKLVAAMAARLGGFRG